MSSSPLYVLCVQRAQAQHGAVCPDSVSQGSKQGECAWENIREKEKRFCWEELKISTNGGGTRKQTASILPGQRLRGELLCRPETVTNEWVWF